MRDLKVISFNSFLLSLLVYLKPMFANSGFAGASNALLATILTALFCSSLESVYVSCATSPDRRATSKLWLYYASIQVFSRSSVVEIVLHASIRLWQGRPSLRLYPHALSKLHAFQSEDQDILLPLHFEYLYHVFLSLIHLISSDAFDEIRYSWKQF